MLNIIRIMTIILGGISLIIAAFDCWGVFNFKIHNKTLKGIVYFTFIICSLIFATDDIIANFTGL